MDVQTPPLICSLVSEADRVNELAIFGAMRSYSEDYRGGYWIMWELSNGAFYMAPGDKTEAYKMSCAGNWYDGTMSADAAGIVSCLVAINQLAWQTEEDRFINLFHALREWALEHPEAEQIFRAID